MEASKPAQHTPGPWGTIDGAEIFPLTGELAQVELCRVVGPWSDSSFYDAKTARANANLILAAPALLAACEEISRMASFAECICGPERPADHWTTCPKAYQLRADAAIAQARGGAR